MYAEVCNPVTRQVCEMVHYFEVCRNVTTQECSQEQSSSAAVRVRVF